MTQQRLRIFVSSPGDVLAAREIAAQIIEKVAHEYVRFFAIEPYLWEYEPMLASGHFQDSIDPPSRFDAVILILESRRGTRAAARQFWHSSRRSMPFGHVTLPTAGHSRAAMRSSAAWRVSPRSWREICVAVSSGAFRL